MTTQCTTKQRLGILVCGHSPEPIVKVYGQYDQAFARLLGPDTYDYHSFFPVDNHFPSSADDADAWLLTGSKHGVYEDLPWISPLEELVREIYAKQLPLVGICFGHQIMAQALGGKVEKYTGGWVAGTEHYQFEPETGFNQVVLNAWHQDQVVEKPTDAKVIGSSASCQFAALEYRSNTVSLQPHPEFDNNFTESILEHRGESLPANSRAQAAKSLGQELSAVEIATWLNKRLMSTASPA